MATETYKDHEIIVIKDGDSYFARIDGHDEPLDAETEQEAIEEARGLVDRNWF